MRESFTKRKPELHGLQVGVVLSALCYQKLALLEKKDLKNNIAENIFKADAERIPSVWGSLGPEIGARKLAKAQSAFQQSAKTGIFHSRCIVSPDYQGKDYSA